MLTILDGWGYGKTVVGNAIKQANTPVMNAIAEHYPSTLLQASGLAVGLTWGEPGNSEVGHLNMGAGRIVEQYLSRINRAIEDKSFFQNEQLLGVLGHIQQTRGRLHLVGLLTSGTVHSAFPHIVALLDLLTAYKMTALLHLFVDGKDSGLHEGAELLAKLQKELDHRQCGSVVSIIGRKAGMDRDNNWEMTQKAYELITRAKGEIVLSFADALKAQYANNIDDQHMPAFVAQGYEGIKDGDAMIFFNFREDAIRQLAKAFALPDFAQFTITTFNNFYFCTLTDYLENPNVHVAFPLARVKNSLSEVLSAQGKTQFHITETEKYAHVTYFFNGLHAEPFPNETDALIESFKDHEHNPQMRSVEIADRVLQELQKELYDVIIVNFPNSDIIAHTGNYEATLLAVEAADTAAGRLQQAILAQGGILMVTADHGNAEELTYRGTGERESKHNASPVPFYIVGAEFQDVHIKPGSNPEIGGILGDIAPTILALLGIPQPPEMSGESLLPVLTGRK